MLISLFVPATNRKQRIDEEKPKLSQLKNEPNIAAAMSRISNAVTGPTKRLAMILGAAAKNRAISNCLENEKAFSNGASVDPFPCTAQSAIDGGQHLHMIFNLAGKQIEEEMSELGARHLVYRMQV